MCDLIRSVGMFLAQMTDVQIKAAAVGLAGSGMALLAMWKEAHEE